MRNYRAVIEYDGTDYGGFQVQVDKPTIQGELERALQQLTHKAFRVNGAGRTDAGVHARGQVINFRVEWKHGCQVLQRAMNAVLARDIAVRAVMGVPEDFHARFSATSRVYAYAVYHAVLRSPMMGRFAHHVSQELDVGAMCAASLALQGEHDFAAFGQSPGGEHTRRVVHRVAWRRSALRSDAECGAALPQVLQFEIEANAFLRGMVRRIVGTLLDVGMGRHAPHDVSDILVSRDIQRASPPVPACGLCLEWVRYGTQYDQADRLMRNELPNQLCWVSLMG